jgi:hypothetical protein
MDTCECGVAATQTCARCMNVRYCSRTCQVNHWPRHKTVCNVTATAMSTLLAKIAGNMAAFAAKGGAVHVEIPETTADFIARGIHFVTIAEAPGPSGEATVKFTDLSRKLKVPPRAGQIPSGQKIQTVILEHC